MGNLRLFYFPVILVEVSKLKSSRRAYNILILDRIYIRYIVYKFGQNYF